MREMVGEREAGMAGFIIRGGIFAMPVSLRHRSRLWLMQVRTGQARNTSSAKQIVNTRKEN